MSDFRLALLRCFRRRVKRSDPNKANYESEYQITRAEVPKYLSRFSRPPDFRDKKVLDLGCGLGAMVFHVASCDARMVVGVDILEDQIAFNRERLAREFPQYQDRVSFVACYLEKLDDGDFDIIISKDSFEHIIDLESHLRAIKQRLKPDGRIYVGFAPLYRSIRGDHHRTQIRLPWGHVLFPDRVILQGLKELYPERKLDSIADLGLNKLSLKAFKEMVARTKLRFEYLGVNVTDNPAAKLYSLGRYVPGLSEYFTHNVYAILEHESGS
ncbi:MAG: class I SAM-dependent methyltransferase [Calditrichota bacterium]